MNFLFQKQVIFFNTKKETLVAATFLPVWDYGHLVYMHATARALHILDTVYHAALRFITNFKHVTHRCKLYSQTGSFTLAFGRSGPLFMFQAILVLLPFSFCTSISLTPDRHMLSAPSAQTESGVSVFPLRVEQLTECLKNYGNWSSLII